MIRIRRVYSAVLPADQDRLDQVRRIFRAGFPAAADYADRIAHLLDNPFEYGYSSVLLVSERTLGRVTGFSLFFHFPETNSSFLDYLAVLPEARSRGIGSALYEATCAYLKALGSRGLYYEVLPDEPELLHGIGDLEENRRRLAFYEQHGVRPIAGTEYELPLGEPPGTFLLFDALDRPEPLRRSEARAAARLILRRKYKGVVRPEYIERVVESFIDDPVRFRPPRYVTAPEPVPPARRPELEPPFVFVVGDRHVIHHVRDRGYVERPARVAAIREALAAETDLFRAAAPRTHGDKPIRAVHDADFVTYLNRVCLKLNAKRPVYPYVFPVRRPERKPRDLAVRAGYYCIDTFTPLDANAYAAARAAVDVALTAAEELLKGAPVAYALCRPPGHHAGRRVFGGFCYFNNAAIAAAFLAHHGSVALLDIDFHHGNGSQDIFYDRDDVLTLSIHGHPNDAYPYFSGFADERGEGPGRGFNRNFPLPEGAGADRYLQTLDKALDHVRRFRPMFLLVALGFDTMTGDPTGSFALRTPALREIGRRLAALQIPILVVQEGGYHLRNLKRGAVAFFTGLAETMREPQKSPTANAPTDAGANNE
jgi:acetoin utilization deacetylase AcuC-like enzyme/GNAT superfamily N-acetyltransferase